MALSEETMSKYSGHLIAYKSACEEHPELKSFDNTLQQRTIKVIDKLTAGAETGTGVLSLHDIHIEISKHQLEVSQDVANLILQWEGDLWENNALKSLVLAYFDNIKETLKIFGDVMDCVEKAEEGKDYIEIAVENFDKESAENDVGEKKKRYEETLKYLKKFEALGDPFDGHKLTAQFDLVQEHQKSLLLQVSESKKKIDEEQTNIDKEKKDVGGKIEASKGEKLWGALMSVAAVSAIFIGPIGLIASGVATSVGVKVPLFLPEGWLSVDSFLKKRLDALNKQQEALNKLKEVSPLVDKGVVTNKESISSVAQLIDNLEKKISALSGKVDDAIEADGNEVATKVHLRSIREKVVILTDKLKELGETVEKHDKLISEAKFNVLEKINSSGKYHRG
ncbi:hypothetical protein CARUB_v10017404mg [Capsella rubella]|uniref:Uncharacterized protein n=1 Tax=Capsella rubella TaxID=81985 RepID=R0HGC0_9BRAS|nr:UPF0496 protein At3g28270 [Capsella rubella]EOA24170.1 hypothetical protein CARUB_v10017404mg [Capsella rubella]